jgi:predicted ATPase/DNA-binding CsgD family transcriptional regulator
MLILPLTPFIGRELELAELLGLFKTTRLITVTGPGGSGKTRLAVELSSRCALPDEVVTVVGLDVVSDPALVADAVRVALGVHSAPDTSTDEQVIAELVTSPRLLVLDNCEQVATAVRQFVEAALSAAPKLRVLATSRIVLNVPGEQVWVIPALDMPGPDSGPDDVSLSDAGRLFIERARRSQPGFYLDTAAAASVARICELLDGLPLALELAAAWSSTLSPTELAERLSASLALLNSDDRGQGRNRTLRSMAEWSDALLDPEDRIVLAAISVFAGPFTIGDAEQVAGGDDPLDVVHSLRRLVDSSWVVALPGDETVYGMLNTLRDYGRELLDRGGQEAAVRRRHAQAFTEKAEASDAEPAGANQYIWRARMERAAGDFALALDWATKQGDDDLSLRLVASLWRWWYTSGRIAEGRGWVTAALARSRSASPSLRARALYTSAILAAENGDYDTAQAHAQSAQRAFDAIGDHGGSSRSSTILGNVAKYRGDVAAAMRHLSDAVAGQRTLGDDWATAVALQNLAAFVIDQGDLAHGRELMEDSLSLKRRVGDRRSLGYGLINLSDLLVRERDLDHARTALAEAAGIAVDVSDERLGAFVEHNLGDVCAAANELAQAALHYGFALAGFRRVRDHRDVALAMCSLGRTMIKTGKRNHGLAMLRESERLAAEIGDELRLSEARSALASAENAPATRTLPDGLTARQAEILTLLASGLSNRDIATRLTLSAGTVERHLANVYRKLGVTNRVGATRYALAHGLGSPTKP